MLNKQHSHQQDVSHQDLRKYDKTNSILNNFNQNNKSSNPNISFMVKKSPILLGQSKQNLDKMFQKQILKKQMFNDLQEENTKIRTKNA